MKVLELIDSAALGGAEALLATLATAASTSTLDVAVAVIEPTHAERGAFLSRMADTGIEVQSLGIERLSDPRAIGRVARAVRKSNCDLLHAHLEYASILGPLGAWVAGRPAVCTFHHVAAPLRRRAAVKERMAVLSASASRGVIFVSEASRRSFRERYPGRHANWVVVPNGVDLNIFHPGGDPAGGFVDWPARGPVVTLVGSMRGGKGHEIALRAWPKIVADVPDARLLFVGTGVNESALRRTVSELGIQRSVCFAGARDDVPDLVRESTIVILPSQSEALPTVLMEAAACGVPVVASDVGGVREVVDDDVTGLLLRATTAETLREAVLRLLRNPELRSVLGAAAHRRAASSFGADLWVKRLTTVYERAVRRRLVQADV